MQIALRPNMIPNSVNVRLNAIHLHLCSTNMVSVDTDAIKLQHYYLFIIIVY
jgi:hypothetical protein